MPLPLVLQKKKNELDHRLDDIDCGCTRMGNGRSTLKSTRATNLTWLILGPEGEAVFSVSKITHKGTWFPFILIPSSKLVSNCSYWANSWGYFYVCPAENSRKRRCGGPGDTYCAKWGCETTGHVWWRLPRFTDSIKVNIKDLKDGELHAYSCFRGTPTLNISFMKSGKKKN